MSVDRPQAYLHGLLKELLALPTETEWVEFKVNNAKPEEIGEYISAMANTAVLCGKSHAYIVWGIDNHTHEIVGTEFDPNQTKKGNEELENWLLRLLNPKVHFYFYEFESENKPVVVLEVKHAPHQPVRFQGQEFLRVGSYKKKLKDFPEKERQLWRSFDQTAFEEQHAVENTTAENVLKLLDYPAYFDLLDLTLPENREGILARLSDDGMTQRSQNGQWNITNLGAILFAKNLGDFKHLKRKSVRVIVYDGSSKIRTLREHEASKGYAFTFESLVELITTLLPSNEVIGRAYRETVPMYPEIAIRELVANALIHQDFTMTGTGPMIEIFKGRMEITNPGKPLVETERFLDSPPKSRNENLASFLRRVGICEERGSGIDKVVLQTELYQLPAPVFETTPEHTRTILFAHKPFAKMDKNERIHACYLHACLKYVNREFLTNSSLRERFRVEDHNYPMISKLIRDSLDAGVIHLCDPKAPPKFKKYVPFWG